MGVFVGHGYDARDTRIEAPASPALARPPRTSGARASAP